jgi:hypothetical protein
VVESDDLVLDGATGYFPKGALLRDRRAKTLSRAGSVSDIQSPPTVMGINMVARFMTPSIDNSPQTMKLGIGADAAQARIASVVGAGRAERAALRTSGCLTATNSFAPVHQITTRPVPTAPTKVSQSNGKESLGGAGEPSTHSIATPFKDAE